MCEHERTENCLMYNGFLFQKGTGKLRKGADQFRLGKMIDTVINEIVVEASINILWKSWLCFWRDVMP